jgi:hypothetical protein
LRLFWQRSFPSPLTQITETGDSLRKIRVIRVSGLSWVKNQWFRLRGMTTNAGVRAQQACTRGRLDFDMNYQRKATPTTGPLNFKLSIFWPDLIVVRYLYAAMISPHLNARRYRRFPAR